MRWIAAALIALAYPHCANATNEILRSVGTSLPYQAGTIALAAYPRWDVVVIGPIPAIAGAVKLNPKVGGHLDPALKIVAVALQDNSAHRLMIAGDDYNRIVKDPAKTLPGQKILMTPRSTGQIYAQRCLAGWGLNLDQMVVVEGEQTEVRQAMREKQASVALVWTPFSYLLANEKEKAKSLPCLNMRGLELPTLIVARADLLLELDPARLENNRQKIAEFVAAYLGTWALVRNQPGDAAKRLVKAYADEGIAVTEAQARAELVERRPGNLAEQLIAFKAPSGGAAPIGAALESIMTFMVDTGTLKVTNKPKVGDLLDPSILELISSDPVLRAKAAGGK